MSKATKAATIPPAAELPALDSYVPYQQASCKLAGLCEKRDSLRRRLEQIAEKLGDPVSDPAAEAQAAALLGDLPRSELLTQLIELNGQLAGLSIAIAQQSAVVRNEKRIADQQFRDAILPAHQAAARAIADAIGQLVIALRDEEKLREHLLREGVAFSGPLQVAADKRSGDVSQLLNWRAELLPYIS